VGPAHLPGPGAALAVEHPHLQRVPGDAGRVHLAIQVRAQQSLEEDIELLAVPCTGHVRLAQAEVAFGQRPLECGRVMQLHVPGAVAVDADIRLAEQAGDQLLRGGIQGGGGSRWRRSGNTRRRNGRLGGRNRRRARHGSNLKQGSR